MKKNIATSVSKYLALIDKLNGQMYRGQGNSQWPVIPSLARKVNELKDCSVVFNSWDQVEDHLLNEFKRLTAPWLNYTPQDRYEWLVLVQHHGLPTVLLDMTSNPLKALFFAVENTEHDGFDGAVYALHPVLGWYTSTAEIKENEFITCFYPKHINQRIVSQEACFTAFKFPDKLQPFEPLLVYDEEKDELGGWTEDILIPKSAKPKLRKDLAKIGITHQALFPGLDGIATTIRQSLRWR